MCSYQAQLLSFIYDRVQQRESMYSKIVIDDFKPALLRNHKDHEILRK